MPFRVIYEWDKILAVSPLDANQGSKCSDAFALTLSPRGSSASWGTPAGMSHIKKRLSALPASLATWRDDAPTSRASRAATMADPDESAAWHHTNRGANAHERTAVCKACPNIQESHVSKRVPSP